MKFKLVLAAAVAVSCAGSTALAQNKYDIFVGQYMAAVHIVSNCDGFTVAGEQEAGTIAKTQDRLRRQKVLKFLYYGQTRWLEAQGETALAVRSVDASSTKQVCRYGRQVAGTDDAVGRFLRKK